MDHRCLYGHRVPAAFTFAIQNRSCPTCGASTVTVNGYQAARKLATEAGLDGVAAFHAVRIIEADWVLTPASTSAPAPSPGPALGTPELAAPGVAAAPSVSEEEEVVVEDVAEPATAPVAVPAPASQPVEVSPEPRIVVPVKVEKPRPEPRVDPPAAPATAAGPSITPKPAPSAAPGFGQEEEDFFKNA